MTDTKAAEHYTALAAQIKAERAQRHLHAAAPELLEALDSVLEYIDDRWGYRGQPIDQARKVLAKAKGE